MLQTLKNVFFPLGDLTIKELQEEFKKNYELNADFVRTVIYWTVRSSHTDDLVQETFLKAWKSFRGFEKRANFKTWIYRIALNTCYDFLNDQAKKKSEELIDRADETSSNPELKDLISQGLMKLSHHQREVFILYYKLEFTMSEISELLSVAEGTVKSRLFYAKESFVKFLKDNGVENG